MRDISVGVPAPFTKLVLQQGEVDFKGKQRRITHRDIDDVINASLDFAAPDGYSLIHSTPAEFTIQGAVRADMPIGVMAEGFSAKVSHLYVDNRFKQLVQQHGAEDKVNVAPVFCLGECANGVSVKIDDQLVLGMCEDNVDATWEQLVLPRIG